MREHRTGQAGFSAVDLLATLALIGVLSTIALYKLKEIDNPLRNASAELTGFFKQVRARAIATTSAYHIYASGPSLILTSYGNTCASPSPTIDPQVSLELPDEVVMTDTDWEVCFNGRGLPDANIEIILAGPGGNRTVEVFLGGAVREMSSSGGGA